jgi:nucleolar GTP-binding protein
MLARLQGMSRKRKREEDMDVDMGDEDEGEGEGEAEGEWMDVDGEDGTPKKRVKANSGTIVPANRRQPRTDRRLAGMRDDAVRSYSCLPLVMMALFIDFRSFKLQQVSKAIKLRNLGQRPRNMLAKAGESDRAIRVKMVRFHWLEFCLTLL